MVHTDRAAQSGFSLMEAIVAVALLGLASVPLLSLQSQNARAAIKLEERAATITVERVSLDYLSLIDLSNSGSGNLDVGGGWSITWQAVPATELATAVMSVGQEGRFAAQLVRVEGTVEHSSGQFFTIEVYRTDSRETFPYRLL